MMDGSRAGGGPHVVDPVQPLPRQVEVVAAQPTWKSIRAAEAGQLIEWPAFWLHTYADYADALTKLTADLADVDDSIGD